MGCVSNNSSAIRGSDTYIPSAVPIANAFNLVAAEMNETVVELPRLCSQGYRRYAFWVSSHSHHISFKMYQRQYDS